MKAHLSHPVFKPISELATVLQAEVYVVGGFVRDLILERPSKDIDILVIGHGVAFAEAVAEKLGIKNGIKVFENFGTAMLNYEGYEIEFVGARKESYRKNSRKPIVENGSFEDDIARRDFTINAMAISLNASNYGELIDRYGGQKDLEKKTIRTPLDPKLTFYDDPLRMMRAVRFATQLGFMLHVDVFDAIVAHRERLHIVSIERVTDELNKIIMSPQPSFGFKLLFKTRLLELVFPELMRLQGVEVINNKGHKDNFYHTLEVLDNVAGLSDDLWLRWAALLHDIAKPATKRFNEREGWTFHSHEFVGEKMVAAIFKKMKLPLNEHMKFVQTLVRLHLRPIALAEDNITDSAVRRLLFEAGHSIDALMLLCKADITSKNEAKVRKFLKNLKLVEEKLIEIEEKDRVREFQPPISGEEIMEVFGLGPCREVGIIKNAIKDAILDGIIANNYEEAYAFMLETAKKNKLKKAK